MISILISDFRSEFVIIRFRSVFVFRVKFDDNDEPILENHENKMNGVKCSPTTNLNLMLTSIE